MVECGTVHEILVYMFDRGTGGVKYLDEFVKTCIDNEIILLF